jgi:hypothetical protein
MPFFLSHIGAETWVVLLETFTVVTVVHPAVEHVTLHVLPHAIRYVRFLLSA